jgi:nitroreductase
LDLREVIEKRHMIRSFTGEPVERVVLDRLVYAAAKAPSALNLMPTRFHVATGETREALVKALAMCTLPLVEYYDVADHAHVEGLEEFYGNLGNAPVVIAVSLPVPVDELQRINCYLSAGCAMENLLLTAADEGLGCCNITSSFWVRDVLSEILGLDAKRQIVSLILVGHPAAEPLAPAHNMDIATFHD